MTTDTTAAPPGDVGIVRAGPDRAATVQSLVVELATEGGEGYAVSTTAEQWRLMLGRSDVLVLVATIDGEPVGYVSAVRQLSLWRGGLILALDDLYVRPRARNRSVGRLLMEALAGVADEDDLPIRWEIKPENVDAQRFYTRLGARLRTKVIAVWAPETYRAAGSQHQPEPPKWRERPETPRDSRVV